MPPSQPAVVRATPGPGVLGACLALILLFGTACGTDTGTVTRTGTATSPGIGSGQVVTKDVPVTPFSRLEVSSTFRVTVSFGAQEKLVLRVDDKVVDQVDAGVSDGRLRIGLQPGAHPQIATLQADVTARSLSGISLSGAAAARLSDALTGRAFELTASGAGRLEGPIRVDQAKITMSGGSHAEVNGDAGRLVVRASGAGRVAAAQLQVRELDVMLSGASSAAVAVTETISADLSGASSLRYRGSPRFVRRQLSVASSIAPM